MKHIFPLILSITLFSTIASAGDDLSIKVEQLDTQVQSSLGISIKALSLLIEYEDTRLSEQYMHSSGRWAYFQELTDMGLATLEEQEPVGGLEDQVFSKLLPTKDGEIILRSLR